MKIRFIINNEAFDGIGFGFFTSWNCPHIPRKDDIIDTSVLIHRIDPVEFRESLIQKDRNEWDEIVRTTINNDGLDKQQAVRNTLEKFLDDMLLRVQEVSWRYHEYKDEYYLYIYLANE